MSFLFKIINTVNKIQRIIFIRNNAIAPNPTIGVVKPARYPSATTKNEGNATTLKAKIIKQKQK